MNPFLHAGAELSVGALGLLAGMALAELAVVLLLPGILPPGRVASYGLIVGVAAPFQGLVGGITGLLVGVGLLRAQPRRLAARLTWVVAALALFVATAILLRPAQGMGPDPAAVAGKALGATAGLWLAAGLSRRRPPSAGR